MIYVASDVHGDKVGYYDFINAVNFSNEDTFYIIGDVLDRGAGGISILLDIMKRNNVILLKGNHEHMLLPTLRELSYSDSLSQKEIVRDDVTIMPIGQEETLNDFCRLSCKEQIKIINYLESLDLYKEISVNNQNYILVHAGLPDFEEKCDMDFFEEEELLFGQHNYDVDHFEDTIIIIGHQPTRFIDGAKPDEIYKCGDTINMDCGVGFGGQLGVLCLDTGDELYF